jgi:two-component system, LytTR family, sensor kinase
MNLEGYLTLLVKLAAMAAIASIVARSNTFQSMLMRETRSLSQRAVLALWLGVVFATSVAVRVAGHHQRAYEAADLGLEGSLIAGLLGGYVTGLLSGILISLPALFNREYLTLPLLASVGVLGGLLRDLAPTP